MPDILTYRFPGYDGNPDQLPACISDALCRFYDDSGHWPAVIIVNPKSLGAALGALPVINRECKTEMIVLPCGGCLKNEVWLDDTNHGGIVTGKNGRNS